MNEIDSFSLPEQPYFHGYGSITGSGSYGQRLGSGSGSGHYGDGSDCCGDGDYGSGHGSGSDGYREGYGNHFYYGYRSIDPFTAIAESHQFFFSQGQIPMNELIPGQHYMVALGEGLMFVGRFLRPAGTLGGVFDSVVNIAYTGSATWADLTAGKGRAQARMVPYPQGEVVFPIVRFAFVWADPS